MVTFGEVLRFDPERIAEILRACSDREKACSELSASLRALDGLPEWEGDAAAAARRAVSATLTDVDRHGSETTKIARAAQDCFDEARALVRDAQSVVTDAAANGLTIDPVTGAVTDPNPPNMRGWPAEDKAAYARVKKDIERRIRLVEARADRLDDQLATLIDAASGALSMNPPGESSAFNPAARRANQIAAFRKLYGRDPTSDNDWRIAEMLDPHSYNPKNKSVPPSISVLRIKPVPGQGVVATGLFIPGDKVLGGTSMHRGDNRGFDPNFDPEDTRVSYLIDYENGIVIARQNPSATADGSTVRTGTPKVKAKQLEDGTVLIDYEASDPLAPPGSAAAGWTVNGTTIVTPGPNGARISGDVTDYPSMETYQYTDDGKVRTLHRDDAGDHTIAGPMLNLPLSHEFGDYDSDFDRFPQEYRDLPKAGPIPTGEVSGATGLGPVDDPPSVPGAGG